MFVLGGVTVVSCTFVDLNYPVSASEDNEPAEIIMKSGKPVAEEEFPYEEALAQLCLELRALPNGYGHTVKVHSVMVGGTAEGEHFYRRGTYNPENGGFWTDLAADDENPLTFIFDESGLEDIAEVLPPDYTPILKETCLKVIPQDFSEVGLPVEVDFSIIDGENTVMRDVMTKRVNTELIQGEKFTVALDLTPVAVTFSVTINDWFDDEQNIDIVL